MAWKTLIAADALVSPPEIATLKSIAGASDALNQICVKEVAAARGMILAGGNEMDVDGTLPDIVIPGVLAIIAWRYLNSYPQLKALQTEGREKLFRSANDLLQRISEGSPNTERPDAPVNVKGNLVTLPSVSGRPHRFTHRTEEGI